MNNDDIKFRGCLNPGFLFLILVEKFVSSYDNYFGYKDLKSQILTDDIEYAFALYYKGEFELAKFVLFEIIEDCIFIFLSIMPDQIFQILKQMNAAKADIDWFYSEICKYIKMENGSSKPKIIGKEIQNGQGNGKNGGEGSRRFSQGKAERRCEKDSP